MITDKPNRDSVALLRRLYNEANYGAHLVSLGLNKGGKGLQNRINSSLTSPYIRRHKPSLTVRKRNPSKVRGKLLTRSPTKRRQKLTTPRWLKPGKTKNFIKENIESVGTGTRRRRVEQGNATSFQLFIDAFMVFTLIILLYFKVINCQLYTSIRCFYRAHNIVTCLPNYQVARLPLLTRLPSYQVVTKLDFPNSQVKQE